MTKSSDAENTERNREYGEDEQTGRVFRPSP